MRLTDKKILVTGGAGLIGSALAERLLDDNDVVIVDDLSNGIAESVPEAATFVEGDLTDEAVVAEAIDAETDVVFHLAADKYVNADQPREQFETNGEMTYNILERMNEVGVEHIAFTSSSTVYGEAPRPTPEDYAPLEPISEYGAAKLSEEALLSVYGHNYGFRTWNFRFANIVGPRYGAGVVPDFIYKLQQDPESLTIRGNGLQEKSYMTLEDCIDAMCYVVENTDKPVNTYNLGTRTTTSVNRIADIVSDVMGVDPEYEYTGGDRGWSGDVPKMRLSIEKLAALGWEPTVPSDQAVREGAQAILENAENEPHLS
ncbi:NAD-dependent epimerase/dehydratase family protein [Halorhabdus rudnickae]|uniref:NAD-dependent epimerase/dehydratase family protein n=1 Tax=Halorhabdus rudnickae TaxID=1775544 RepID=UPI001083C99C|nr:NAD-dependent epimerase/dehydratase family protein [Halorhabdus rudnickae]